MRHSKIVTTTTLILTHQQASTTILIDNGKEKVVGETREEGQANVGHDIQLFVLQP